MEKYLTDRCFKVEAWSKRKGVGWGVMFEKRKQVPSLNSTLVMGRRRILDREGVVTRLFT